MAGSQLIPQLPGAPNRRETSHVCSPGLGVHGGPGGWLTLQHALPAVFTLSWEQRGLWVQSRKALVAERTVWTKMERHQRALLP